MAYEVEKVDVLLDSPAQDVSQAPSEEALPVALESRQETCQTQGAGRDGLEEEAQEWAEQRIAT